MDHLHSQEIYHWLSSRPGAGDTSELSLEDPWRGILHAIADTWNETVDKRMIMYESVRSCLGRGEWTANNTVVGTTKLLVFE